MKFIHEDPEFAQLVQFIRLGAVLSLEDQGQRVIVNFNPGFNSSGLGATNTQF